MVNIGAAGGYYAVGFLRRCPRVRVTAFEASGVHRSALASLASTNGVDRRLSIRDACDSRALGGALVGSERTLLVVDVEGAELALLDPERIGSLRTVWMLVEVHDFVDEETSAVLRRRFEQSHRIRVVDSRERTVSDLPTVKGLSPRTLRSLASEGRPTPMQWFWMTPQEEARPAEPG